MLMPPPYFVLPSPVEPLQHPVFEACGISVSVKRDDKIDAKVSGNKWRKLKWNLQNALDGKKEGILSFGGAYSNHLHALAFAGNYFGLKTIGLVRGHEADLNNPTLRGAVACGMVLHPLAREEYRQKNQPEFLQKWAGRYPNFAHVPEGGANALGARGCMEILAETPKAFDAVVCPVGTATTFAGLVAASKPGQTVYGVAALKGADYLQPGVENLVAQCLEGNAGEATFRAKLLTQFHFGGFGKVTRELVEFINEFYATTGLPLDPVYTAKAMWAVITLCEQGHWPRGTRVLFVHTGGLQGIAGMNEFLRGKKKPYQIETDSGFL